LLRIVVVIGNLLSLLRLQLPFVFAVVAFALAVAVAVAVVAVAKAVAVNLNEFDGGYRDQETKERSVCFCR
jgi:hypothetical protein